MRNSSCRYCSATAVHPPPAASHIARPADKVPSSKCPPSAAYSDVTSSSIQQHRAATKEAPPVTRRCCWVSLRLTMPPLDPFHAPRQLTSASWCSHSADVQIGHPPSPDRSKANFNLTESSADIRQSLSIPSPLSSPRSANISSPPPTFAEFSATLEEAAHISM